MAPRATRSSRSTKSQPRREAPKKTGSRTTGQVKRKPAPAARKPSSRSSAASPPPKRGSQTKRTPSAKKTAPIAPSRMMTKARKDDSATVKKMPRITKTTAQKSDKPEIKLHETKLSEPPKSVEIKKSARKKDILAAPVMPPLESDMEMIEPVKQKRGRKSKPDELPISEKIKLPAKRMRKSPTAEFLEQEDMLGPEEDDLDLDADMVDLDPLDAPVLLDPDLIPVPPSPAPAPPKPKVGKLAPRLVKCMNCGNEFAWVSVEGLCFTCVKRKLAQKKREEDYSGYTDESSGDGEDY